MTRLSCSLVLLYSLLPQRRKTRDEMSHNILLMLEECNKFREHQSREILIELLQDQLVQRKKLLEELKRESDAAEKLLDD